VKGLATPTGPESCGGTQKDAVEALTGVRAGRVFSCESTSLQGADAVEVSGRQDPIGRYRETLVEPCAVRDPEHVQSQLAREPGDPVFAHENGTVGRAGKSKDIRRR